MRVSAALLLTASLVIFGCRSQSASSLDAPAFELKDLSGQLVSLASFKGQPVLLDFWATWCGPCRMSIPMLQKFYEAHKDKGLVVLGINMDEDPTSVYSFVKKFGITYPVLYGGNADVGARYGVQGIPTFVFLDKQGRVADRFEGFSEEMAQAWERDLQILLAQ